MGESTMPNVSGIVETWGKSTMPDTLGIVDLLV
jgi:hypothetical protein